MTRATSASTADIVRIGFMPLTDCAPVVAASLLGFAEAEGLRVKLAKEASWATLRDRIAVRHLDAAHMLAPMPIAANLGLTPLVDRLIVPITLGFGGNTITVSRSLWADLKAAGAPTRLEAAGTARALAEVVAVRQRLGAPKLVFGVVHQHSAHQYQLSYWLAAAGIMPNRDIDIVAVPPPLMPAALAGGQIDGFCAGEPWGRVASTAGSGRVVTTNVAIWRSSPEKVLGVAKDWAEEEPERHLRLVRAIYKAAVWCDDPAHRMELAQLLSRPEIFDLPVDILRANLERRILLDDGREVLVDGYLNFAGRAATFPWTSHAAWFYAQMVRWGEVRMSTEGYARAQSTYRPDIHRAALAPLGVPLPTASAKIEGTLAVETPVPSTVGRLFLGPDRFFDGAVFDPERLEDYLAATPVKAADTA
ncbi:MAG: CmpA/NrtA family ABC transporter substrate-binding protein [Hyphomicrobiaceae bacterium]